MTPYIRRETRGCIFRSTPRGDMTEDDDYTGADEIAGADEVAAELGYAELDWATLDQANVSRHDEIIEMDLEALDDLDLDALDDLSRWAAAQAYADYDIDERFQAICLMIVRSEKQHAAIEYGEICLELANDYMLDAAWDDAVFLLPDLERHVPDDPTIRARFGAMINLLRGNIDDGLAVFQELVDEFADDAETLVTIAEDLLGCEQPAAARSVLDKAEELARSDNDAELITAIEEAREFADELEQAG